MQPATGNQNAFRQTGLLLASSVKKAALSANIIYKGFHSR
jgi:hypothetical protein